MRIARVLTRLNLGGPTRQVLASDPRLTRLGHELRLFVGEPEEGEGDLFDQAVEAGLDVVRVPGLQRGPNPLRDYGALRRLRKELRAFQPELVHTHASKAGALGRRAAKVVPNAARIHTFHGHVLEGYFSESISKLLVNQERRLALQTDRIVAVSHATAEDLVRLGVCEEERLVVVPPGVELQRLLEIDREAPRPQDPLRTRLGLTEDDVLVGVVGRLAEVKQPAVAVDVFAMLAERFPKMHLAFIGDGDKETTKVLEHRISELPSSERSRVHLLGALHDPFEIFHPLDALLLTSRTEGLPVAIIEASAAGLATVATDVGGISELIAAERTGWLGGDVDELAFGLSHLLESADERRATGHRARLRAAKRHTGDALATRLDALYRSVVEDRRCAS